jgi:hypothetical protein
MPGSFWVALQSLSRELQNEYLCYGFWKIPRVFLQHGRACLKSTEMTTVAINMYGKL